VTVLEKNAQILEKEEGELAGRLSHVLVREGVELLTGAELQRVQCTSAGKVLTYHRPQDGERTLVVESILVALGRRPALENLGLERIGVKTTKKGIEVDKTLRTSVPHIWAAGDVASGYKFTHIANAQGSLAAQNAFAEHPMPFDDRVIPWVTFTDPPLAHVGRTERELQQQNVKYKTACQEWKTVERALIMGQTEGLIKLLVDEQGHLLGGHILGPRADELLAPLVLAMHSALPIAQLASAMLPYPTLSEGLRETAE
jgi:pyruvate/2-oxoglutarate dehydrogenase complex dihydrolipoamide dehydrogenase (E3) component